MCSFSSLSKSGVCSTEGDFKTRDDYADHVWTLLQYRSQLRDLENICANHEKTFLRFFESKNPFCVDPENTHPKVKRKVYTRISLNMYFKIFPQHPTVVPGHGLCTRCYTSINAKSKRLLQMQVLGCSSPSPSLSQSSPTSTEDHQTPDSPVTTTEESWSDSSYSFSLNSTAEENLKNLNTFLKLRGISIDMSELANASSRESKLEQIQSDMKLLLESIALKQIHCSSDYWNEMLTKLKERYLSCGNSAEKLQILSLLPSSWSEERIMEEFGLNQDLVADQTLISIVKEEVFEDEFL